MVVKNWSVLFTPNLSVFRQDLEFIITLMKSINFPVRCLFIQHTGNNIDYLICPRNVLFALIAIQTIFRTLFTFQHYQSTSIESALCNKGETCKCKCTKGDAISKFVYIVIRFRVSTCVEALICPYLMYNISSTLTKYVLDHLNLN